MVKKNFESTEAHLRNTMTKQAGSIEKAYLEAVMNSKDADSEDVTFNVHEDETIIEDNGSGFTSDMVDTIFKQFGYEGDDQDEKVFGKFRMGRGQMFNFGVNIWHTNNNVLITNIKEDKTTVSNFFGATEDDEGVIEADEDEVVLDTSGLGFHHFQTDNEYNGCRIQIRHYKQLTNLADVENEFSKLTKYIPFATGIEINFNGTTLDDGLDYTFETENAWFKLEPDNWSNRLTVYNMGARVKSTKLGPVGGVVVSKKDLDVNFARNDIIDGCPVWGSIKSEYNDATYDALMNKTEVSVSEANWLIEQAIGGGKKTDELRTKPILSDVEGGTHSVETLADKTISFAKANDSTAERVMDDSDTIILDEKHEKLLKEFTGGGMTTEDYKKLVDQELSYGGHRFDPSDLSSRRKKNLDKVQWALNQLQASSEGYHLMDTTLEVGVSKVNDVWREDDDLIVVDKNALNCSRQELAVNFMQKFIKVCAAEGDTRQGHEEDMNTKSRIAGFFEVLPDIQNNIL